jgi:hypothetical protein
LKEEKRLAKNMAEAILASVAEDEEGFAQCLMCDSFGSYCENVRHIKNCVYYDAKLYLEKYISE